jgi:hypothetical protein
MKKLVVYPLLWLLFAPAAGWAQRNTTAAPARPETRVLPSFTAIDVSDGIQLVVRPGQPTLGGRRSFDRPV